MILINFSHRRVIFPHKKPSRHRHLFVRKNNASYERNSSLFDYSNIICSWRHDRKTRTKPLWKGHTSHHWFLSLSAFFSGPTCTILNKHYLYKYVVGYKTFCYGSKRSNQTRQSHMGGTPMYINYIIHCCGFYSPWLR